MFKKVVVLLLGLIAVSAHLSLSEAFYADGSNSSDNDPRDSILSAQTKNSYEAQLGLVPDDDPLGSSGDGISDYEIQQSIIDMKREKKRILREAQGEQQNTGKDSMSAEQKFKSELQRVRELTEAAKKKEKAQKKVRIVQALFLVLCLGTAWYIKSRPADI